MADYFRPIVQTDIARPNGAYVLAGGWTWFDTVEVMSRNATPRIIPAADVPDHVLSRLTSPRGQVAALDMARANIMGILNVTPDSFSDGGKFEGFDAAITHAIAMQEAGADMLDIGGESTRPGAAYVPSHVEIGRTAPVISALRNHDATAHTPISIDTRKADVAEAALAAGATLVNDVYAMTHDPAMGAVTASSRAPICLMHASGDPETMQDDPQYDDVVLDVYDFLSERIEAAVACGIARTDIWIDPGIGFGKTLEHNLALLKRLSVLHGLGCPILLGASRKRFIGTITNAPQADQRVFGSVAVALEGFRQGVQITRVHDIEATRAAFDMAGAICS